MFPLSDFYTDLIGVKFFISLLDCFQRQPAVSCGFVHETHTLQLMMN